MRLIFTDSLVSGGGLTQKIVEARSGFWVREPVLNPYTRLAVAMSPSVGILRAIGYDVTGADLPEPVTQICELALVPEAG